MKLLLAEIQRYFSLRTRQASSRLPEKIKQALEADGLHVEHEYLDESLAVELGSHVKALFSAHQDKLSSYCNGNDVRFFGVDVQSDKFDFFINNDLFNGLRDWVQGFRTAEQLVMANVVTPKPDNLGSGGGWHRDSPFRNQFKAFLYLSDVKKENGPLVYLPGSHCRESMEQVTALLNVKPACYRFTDEQVNRVIDELNYTPCYFTGRPGTMAVANVRGLHRGTPIESGERIALTNYYLTRPRAQ